MCTWLWWRVYASHSVRHRSWLNVTLKVQSCKTWPHWLPDCYIVLLCRHARQGADTLERISVAPVEILTEALPTSSKICLGVTFLWPLLAIAWASCWPFCNIMAQWSPRSREHMLVEQDPFGCYFSVVSPFLCTIHSLMPDHHFFCMSSHNLIQCPSSCLRIQWPHGIMYLQHNVLHSIAYAFCQRRH